MSLLILRNPFGGNAFGSGLPAPFPGQLPQQGFGQFGNPGAFYNGGMPFQGGNMFPAGGAGFPPRSFSSGPMGGGFPPRSFSPGPMGGGQFGSGFGVPIMPGNGFMNQQIPPPFVEPNQFGSGDYNRPRSRHASRHRSKSRGRRGSASSSSDDEYRRRGSPFAGPGNPYQNMQPYLNMQPYPNMQPFQNMPPLSPRAGSPVIPPRRPVW